MSAEAAYTLEDFVARALRREGAVVEAQGRSLDVLVLPELATRLGIDEYERLVFDSAAPVAGTRLVDYDTPLVERLGAMASAAGAMGELRHTRPALRAIDAERVLAAQLTLHNGVARLRDVESVTTPYAGFVVQYDVLADERTSGLVEIWVNPLAHSVPAGTTGLFDDLEQSHEDVSGGDRKDALHAEARTTPELLAAVLENGRAAPEACQAVATAWPIAKAALEEEVSARVQPFLESLSRRRNRDLQRLHDYYRDIHDEIARKASRRGQAALDQERDRLAATIQAHDARVDEVLTRYRARTVVTPVAVLVCAMPAWRLRVQLRRRSTEREVIFVWSSLGRALEARACEGCSRCTLSAFLCDDHVHYVCASCFAPCDQCGKVYCHACHAHCPKRHGVCT